jgi:hypothetical protein
MKLFLLIGILLLGLTFSLVAAKPAVKYKNYPILWQVETTQVVSPKQTKFYNVISSKRISQALQITNIAYKTSFAKIVNKSKPLIRLL